MKIAVVGSSGYIANFLLRRLSCNEQIETIVRIDKTDDADWKLDLGNTQDFDYDRLSGLSALILTAAISSPDKCATDFDICWNVNVTGTMHLIEEATKRGCRVLFFSSDAVFGNGQTDIFSEESPTHAQTPYGLMKKAVEDHFRGNPLFKAIRLSYVVSAKDRFISYCLRCMQDNIVAEIFHPFYRNCITVTNVVDVVEWMITHWEAFAPQFLNVAGPELVSRLRMADELNRLSGGSLRYSIITPNADFFANRPPLTQMKSLYLEKIGLLTQKTFTELFQSEMKGMKL